MTPRVRTRIEAIARERLSLIERLRKAPVGLSWCEEHTRLADGVVSLLVSQLGSGADRIAVIAVGGYGRRELSPFSDIDLTLVPAEDGTPEIDADVRELFRMLHDAFGGILGMEIAYSYRLVGDAAGLDAKTRTGLMDARLVAGSPELARSLQDALDETFAPGEFILDKIQERERMMAKHHDTPLVVEPHLKEGAGGIRCFHCANWLRAAIGERDARPPRAYDAVVRRRNLLHTIAGKRVDVLTRPRQQELADCLCTDPFDLMSAHAEDALQVHQLYLRAVERLHEARFALSRGCLAMRGEARIMDGTDAGEAAVGIAVASRLGLRVPDLKSSAAACRAGGSAAYALSAGESILRNIDRAGLLDQMLPELTACRTLIPRDSIHAFTVFEHSLRVVRMIDDLPPDSYLGRLREGLSDQEALYLAALLHDVGKRESEADHPQIGARIAREVGARWGLSERVSETVAWLIQHHLEISHILRFRDLAEPSTAREFSELVRDQDRLNMLCLLAFADVAAVAPDLWTAAQQSGLEELHGRTSEALGGRESALTSGVGSQRSRLLRELAKTSVSPVELEAFVESLPVHYLNSTPFELVRFHMGMVAKARAGSPTVDAVVRQEISATDFTISATDRAGLLSEILGTFYALDLRVQAIRACTTRSGGADQPVALDVFSINFNGRPVPAATTTEALGALEQVLRGEREASALLKERGKDPDRVQRVLSYRYIEGLPGILEVRAPRGRGLPYRLSRWVATHGWNIQSARLGQWADNASAALYLTWRDGSVLTAEQVATAMATTVQELETTSKGRSSSEQSRRVLEI